MALFAVDQIEKIVQDASAQPQPCPRDTINVALLTGGFDKPYAFGLAMALVSQSICLDYIGSDEMESPELHANAKIKFLNLRGSRDPQVGPLQKVSRTLAYYTRLIRYARTAKPRIFHILWNNKFQLFDRTLLMLYYKVRKKKVVFTAHNVNAGKRDSADSFLNRLTLKIQYRLSDHIFVHTEKSKDEIVRQFGIREPAISVIPFGINNSAPETALTSEEAKRQLGVAENERIILFFGNIGPYKGVEYLVAAFQQVAATNADYRLIIAGRPRGGCQAYVTKIEQMVHQGVGARRVLLRIEYVPDEQTELYFKAADVLVLPYREVSQSGVLFLGYRFGLPVIAADVGSLREDIVEGVTGLVCKPCDPASLAATIERYFESDLFKDLENRRQEIQDYANARHSWDVVGKMTRAVYDQLLEGTRG